MKIRMLITAVFAVFVTINAMEEKTPSLKGMLLEPASLKFQAAWQVAQGSIPEGRAPKEVLEFVDKIKIIQACTDCTDDEKKFFINLLNSPDITIDEIKKSFPDLIKKSLGKKGELTSLKQLVNEILLRAVLRNKIGLVNLALLFEADINYKHKIYGKTALIYATQGDHREIAQMLLAKGADVNAQDNDSYTALMGAAMGKHTEIAQMLLDNNANFNIKDDDGRTALWWTINPNAKKIAAMLLAKGADVDAKTLNKARREQRKEIFRMLKDAIKGAK